MPSRKRRKSSGPPVVPLVVGGAVLLVVAAVVALLVLRKGKPTTPAGVAGAVADALAPPPKLPAGWSYNDPGLGFRLAWPVAAGPDGYAPKAAISNGNAVGAGWYAKANGITYFADFTDLPDVVPGTIAANQDGILDKIVQKGLGQAGARGQLKPGDPVPTFTKITLDGRPARESRFANKGERTTGRITLAGTHLWFLTVTHPPDVPHDDPLVTRFLNSFAAR